MELICVFNRFSCGKYLFILICLLWYPVCGGTEKIFPDPLQVRPLTERHLIVSISFQSFYEQLFRKRDEKRLLNLKRSPFTGKYILEMEYRGAVMDLVREFRGGISDTLRGKNIFVLSDPSGGKIPLETAGYYLLPEGHLLHFPDVKVSQFHMIHHTILRLKEPLRKGQYILHGPFGIRHSFYWDIEKSPSSFFQVMDCSSESSAPRVGLGSYWMGTGSKLDLAALNGKTFELVRAADSRTVYQGKCRLYRERKIGRNIPLRGSQTLVFDFSPVRAEGIYYLKMLPFGISEKFRITSGNGFSRMQFYLDLLKKRRCHHCHINTARGDYPGEAASYRKSPRHTQRGFFTRSGESFSIKLSTFLYSCGEKEYPLIPGLFGGWHEDPSGRKIPAHLEAVNAMLCALLWLPGRKGDQDLLKEALYGLDLFRRVQEKNGSVALRVERVPMRQNELILAAPGRRSTLCYAQSAALAALVLQERSLKERSLVYRESALRAWNYALNERNLLIRSYRTVRKNRVTELNYYEDASLEWVRLLDCGVSLYLLTGEKDFLHALRRYLPRIRREISDYGKKLPPWSLAVLLWKRPRVRYLEELYFFAGKQLLAAAERCMKEDGSIEGGSVENLLMESLILAGAWYFSGNGSYYCGAWWKSLLFSGLNPAGKDLIVSGGIKDLPDRQEEITRVWGMYFPADARRGKKACNISLLPGEHGRVSYVLSRREQRKGLDALIPVYFRNIRLGIFSRQYSGSGEESIVETAGSASALFYLLQTEKRDEKSKKNENSSNSDLKK